MPKKEKITWKKLGSKSVDLSLTAASYGISKVRQTGESAGESVANKFIKESDSDEVKTRKANIGKKTGSLTSSLLSFGIVGSFIMDIADELDSEKEKPIPTTEQPEANAQKPKVVVTDAEPVDWDKDGNVDGADINGDGGIDIPITEDGIFPTGSDTVVYVNVNGEALPDLKLVEGHERESGYVEDYLKTVADGDESNNLRPPPKDTIA